MPLWRAQEVTEGYDTEICFLDKSIDDDKNILLITVF